MSKQSEIHPDKKELLPDRQKATRDEPLFVDVDDSAAGGGVSQPIDLRQLWSMLWRHKGVILLVALLVFAVNLVTTMQITPTYRATVMIKVSPSTSSVLEYDVEAGSSYYSDYTYYQTQLQMLTSRPLIRRTIDELGLEKSLGAGPSAPEEAKESPLKLGTAPVENSILGKLTVESSEDSQIIKLHVDDEDPTLAATIANSLAENYIRMNLESRIESASYAKDFLNEQLALAKSRLRESEEKLVEYEKQEGIVRTSQEADAATLSSSSIDAIKRSLSEAVLMRIQAQV